MCEHSYEERYEAGDPADGYCAICTYAKLAAAEALIASSRRYAAYPSNENAHEVLSCAKELDMSVRAGGEE